MDELVDLLVSKECQLRRTLKWKRTPEGAARKHEAGGVLRAFLKKCSIGTRSILDQG